MLTLIQLKKFHWRKIMKVIGPKYVSLLLEKYDATENALISKRKITTTEKIRMNSLIRDLLKTFRRNNEYVYCRRDLSNINIKSFFVDNDKDLLIHGNNNSDLQFYYRLIYFNEHSCTLNFNKEKLALSTAKNYIETWCQEFDKGLGSEKDLQKGSFYYLNEDGGYSACDNTDGDCFCEDFKTEEEAIKYLNNEDFNLMENNNAKTQV